MEAEKMKKTGATPIVEEGIGGGDIQGVVELRTVIVKMKDGHGKDMVRIGFVVPGGEVYLIEERDLNMKQAQTWVKKGVLKALGIG